MAAGVENHQAWTPDRAEKYGHGSFYSNYWSSGESVLPLQGWALDPHSYCRSGADSSCSGQTVSSQFFNQSYIWGLEHRSQFDE